MTPSFDVFFSLAFIILIGASLRYLMPELDIDDLRRKLHRLVLAIFLPALSFRVIAQVEVKSEFWQVPLCALIGLVFTLFVGRLIYRRQIKQNPKLYGPILMAGAFGNVTYLGIPVLEGLFKHLGRAVATALLFEITITPCNLVAGSGLASLLQISPQAGVAKVVREILRLPLIWSIALALIFNLGKIPIPAFMTQSLDLLGQATSGIMIIALGMALKSTYLKDLHTRILVLLPCLILKLAVSPLVVLAVATLIAVDEPYRSAAVIESAMPTQLVTLAVADRFGFDVEVLATVIFLSTIVSFFTIPLVRFLITPGGGSFL